MRRFIIFLTAIAVSVSVSAQARFHLEFGGGSSDNDYCNTALIAGVDLAKAPITLGLRYSSENYWNGWSNRPSNTVGIVGRFYTGKRPFRASIDVNADVTFDSIRYMSSIANERSLWVQPALEYHIHDVVGFRLGMFRFGGSYVTLRDDDRSEWRGVVSWKVVLFSVLINIPLW